MHFSTYNKFTYLSEVFIVKCQGGYRFSSSLFVFIVAQFVCLFVVAVYRMEGSIFTVISVELVSNQVGTFLVG